MPEKKVTPILEKSGTNTNLMRGRDVRRILMTRNVDPEVKMILETLAEINHTNCLAIAEIATMLDQTINIVQKFSDIAGNMKERTDQMARAMGEAIEGEDESESSIN